MDNPSNSPQLKSLQRRHNGRDGVSNHQPHDCLLKRLFRRRSKKTSKLTGLCVVNSPITGEFPAQRTSNAVNVSIWWRHHVWKVHDLMLKSAYSWKTGSDTKSVCSLSPCYCWYCIFTGWPLNSIVTHDYLLHQFVLCKDAVFMYHCSVSWQQQAITWTNADLSSQVLCDIYPREISQDIRMHFHVITTRVVSNECTPGFACREFSGTTLVCFIVNEHTTKCSRYKLP